ncbi:undecaprenyldiphospho-muramoylpentapeptide beta-N-acetylglucosaminyltransferase, partial [bacterium]
LYNMEDALAAADLVICRAGAATLAEITALGLPSILIPYPYAAENHQEYNARALADRGAALLIKDSELSGHLLLQSILKLLENKPALDQMTFAARALGRPQALAEIMQCLSGVLMKGR